MRPTFLVIDIIYIQKKNMTNFIHIISRALYIDQGHILLCKIDGRDHNIYHFLPGGHVELGESAQAALIRELKEEIGHEFKVDRFLGVLENKFDRPNGAFQHEYTFHYLVSCPTLKYGQEIAQLESHIKPIWVPLSSLDTIDFRPTAILPHVSRWLKSDDAHTFISTMEK